jgi:predicted amidohydrolase
MARTSPSLDAYHRRMSNAPPAQRSVRIAVAQVASMAGEKSANLEHADTLMRNAADTGAEAIVFPEMFLTGYAVWD